MAVQHRHKKMLSAAALALNFFGTLLLSYSFQAKSSEFRLTKTEYNGNNIYSICANNEAIASHAHGYGLMVGVQSGCIDGHDNHVAIVTSEHPAAARWGMYLNMAGFAVQAIVIIL